MRTNLFSLPATLLGFAAVLLTPAGGLAGWSGDMPVGKREDLRDEVLRAFRHAYGSYMEHACELGCPWSHRQVLSAERVFEST